MELDEAIKKRRSIRAYKDKELDISLVKQCVEAACNAPSAHNSQPWHFIIVKDAEKRKALAKTHGHTDFLADAPFVITVLAEEQKSPRHFVMDCSAAVMLFLLKAAELGLAACWTDAHGEKREDHVKKVLELPDKYRVLCNIAVGYSDEQPREKQVMTFDQAADVV